MSVFRIAPRYYRWHVDPGVDWVETSTDYAHLDWQIAIDQAALVLVDVWEGHYLADCETRINKVVEDNLSPVLTCVRNSGMRVIHAPSPDTAKRQPGWVNLTEKNLLRETDPDWPPRNFVKKEAEFAAYARPFEPRDSELEELHRFCKANGILFLFYAGFNTNCCVLLRDYGTLAMRDRGYEVILVRDCTTGMESYDSQYQLGQTNSTILFLEMFRAYSTTSDEIICSLENLS